MELIAVFGRRCAYRPCGTHVEFAGLDQHSVDFNQAGFAVAVSEHPFLSCFGAFVLVYMKSELGASNRGNRGGGFHLKTDFPVPEQAEYVKENAPGFH
jgi:hypothetical protein